MPAIIELFDLFGSNLGNLFGTGMVTGIIGIIIFFIIAYKFELPPILILFVVMLSGYLMASSYLGDWVKASALIVFGVLIALFGYKVLYG